MKLLAVADSLTSPPYTECMVVMYGTVECAQPSNVSCSDGHSSHSTTTHLIVTVVLCSTLIKMTQSLISLLPLVNLKFPFRSEIEH